MTENKYKCNICQKIYSGYQSLWIHNNKYHKYINDILKSQIPQKSKLCCKYCNKLLSCKQAKYQHHKTCKKKDLILEQNIISTLPDTSEQNIISTLPDTSEQNRISTLLSDITELKNQMITIELKNQMTIVNSNMLELKNQMNEILKNKRIPKIKNINPNVIISIPNNIKPNVIVSIPNNIINNYVDEDINNYVDEDLEKYHNKDCVYILNIKDNIYKYGASSHLINRLQAHKTNLNYKKIIHIYVMDTINESTALEKKIKKMVNYLHINIIYNKHIKIFQIDNIDNIINKFNELELKVKNTKSNSYLELENQNLKLQIEVLKLQSLNNK
jgi:predicted GIY-YIG superfamily endonuclease